MNYMYRFVVGVIAGFGVLSPVLADNICQKTISIASSVADDWNTTCQSTHRTNYYDPYNPLPYNAKFYTFTLDRDADIKATVTNGYNNRFYLLDGNSTNGTILKEVSGSNLEVYLPAGTYTLETTSQYSMAYTLSLQYNDLGSTTCVREITPGVSISDGWVPGCESSHRDIVDPYSPYPDLGFRAKFFTFSLPQDSDIRIDINSEESAYIYLLDGHGEFGAPVLQFSQEPVLTSLPAGDYTIELTTQEQYAPGNFTILMEVIEGASICTQELEFNQVTSGTWSNACLIQSWVDTNNDPYAGVNPERGMYYTFTVDEATDYRFDIRSGDVPVVLNLYQDSDFTQLLHSTKSSSYYYASLGNKIETRLAAGAYTLEVTSHDQVALGEFSFEAKVLANSACATAVEMGSTSNGLVADGCYSQFRKGSNNDPYGPQPGSYFAKHFEFTLTEPGVVELSTYLSSTDAYLYLASKDTAGFLTLIEETTPAYYWDTDRSQTVARVLDKGTYVAEVTTYYPANTSSYSFTVKKGLGTACQIFAPLDETRTGFMSSTQCPSSFKESYQIYDPYNPQPAVQFGSKTITFKVETATDHTFEVSAAGFKPHMFLVTGIDRDGTLLLDQRFTDNAGTFIQYLEPGFYTLELTSAQSSGAGTFTFSVHKTEYEEPSLAATKIQFIGSEYEVTESGKKVIVTLQRIDNMVGEVSVNYATVSDTAFAGVNFTDVSGTVVFAEGEQTKTIEIQIIDDSLDQDDKTFKLELSDAVGAEIKGGNSVLVKIADDDVSTPGSIKLVDLGYNVNRADGKIRVIVERVNGSDGEITVSYHTTDGTALGGQHFTQASGVLLFGDGETRKVIEIEILDSEVGEEDITFGLTLSDASGSQIEGEATVELKIAGEALATPAQAANKKSETFTLSLSVWTLLVTGLFLIFVSPRRRINLKL